MIRLENAECIEFMSTLEDKSIDMCLTDIPFGTTACSWDSIVPFEPMWSELKRIMKDSGAIVLHAQQPFTSALIMSNPKIYRHQWVWNKNNSAGFALAKIRPFAICEDILVFGKNKVNYYPIMVTRGEPRLKGGYSTSDNYGITPSKSKSKSNIYYPKNLLEFGNASQKGKVHPTQKPVALLEYLIKTYTQEGETVLDFTMGSGSTGIAALNTNRNFIGCELDKGYFDIAQERINIKLGELNDN